MPSKTVTSKTAEYGTFSSSSNIPRCLRNNKVVIAGGGPAGLFTAVSLHTVGVRDITVLERDNYDSKFDLQRSYVFALGERGRVAASKVPGLLEHLFKFTPAPNGYKTSIIEANAPGIVKAKEYPMANYVKNRSQGTLYFRPRYMMAYLEYVREHCRDVAFVQNARIDDVTFSNENGGMSTVHYTRTDDDGNSEDCSIEANLLIACDGVNSAVVEALKKADPSVVQSPHGFDATFLPTPPTHRMIRSLLLGRNIFENVDEHPEDMLSSHWIVMASKNKKLACSILPILKEDRDGMGGILANLNAPDDDPLWEIRSTEEAYKYFENSFPGLDIRANISEESLQAFLFGRNVKFPVVRQRHSMGAKVGDQGGVVVLGDAAHAVPPDIGQGLNSSVEDVHVMINCATELPHDATNGDLSYLFHEKRIDDVKAMTKLSMYGNIRNKPKWMHSFVPVDIDIRQSLHGRFPCLFDPPFLVLLSRNIPYTEVVRRQRVMTFKLIFIFLIFAALIWVGISHLLPLLSKMAIGLLSLFTG